MRVLYALVALPGLVMAETAPEPGTAPFGAWPSPISAAQLAQSAVRLGDIRVAEGKAYWWESRPAEGGRYVVVTPNGQGGISEITPRGFNSRTRVHEYGGSPYAVSRGTVFFSNWTDQRLYSQTEDAPPAALTPAGYRYADCVAAPATSQLVCVREDHTRGSEPRNAVVLVPMSGGAAGHVLFDETDFVAYPRISGDGRKLAWIAWNHPDMPWETTTLYVADLVGNAARNIRKVTAGRSESVLEPRWDADGALYFISDRTNWWNLYRWQGGSVEAVAPMDAELATPLWLMGLANYALTGDGRAVLRYGVKAVDKLAVVDLRSGRLRTLDLPFASFESVGLLTHDSALAIAASGHHAPAIIEINLTSGRYRALRAPSTVSLDPATIAVAEPIEFATTGGTTAHAFLYQPVKRGFAARPGELPPLLVNVHGGPTGHTRPILNLGVQYWTSRGFAFVDVNYRGSSGYGRKYRRQLNGNWGVVDVEDAVAVVRHLAAADRVDVKRTAIRGGSAGGFTTLATLAFHDTFKAGANHFGISDLEKLARETHKFESRYLDRLLAPLPQGKTVYDARSPLRHLEGFNEPLITFQGLDDKIVPPEQSRLMVEALKAKGVPVAYIEFEDEQHGFRAAKSIERAAEAELYFYGKVFGFTPDGAPRPVQIDNLDAL